jgi:lysophospholipase L1-like esterase
MRLPLLALLLTLLGCASAPTPVPPPVPAGEDPLRWTAEVEALEAQPAGLRHPIVFVGSSSIRLWDTLEQDMAPLPVLRRGFGGSRISDAVYWLDRLVTPHAPSVVVVFSGTNDLAGDGPRDAAWVAARFDELVARLRDLGCDAPLAYIAISPTPARERNLDRVLETNDRIRARCEASPDLHFVDTASGLLDDAGRPDPRWFVGDRLHLNADGYALWTARVRPLVERLYDGRGR